MRHLRQCKLELLPGAKFSKIAAPASITYGREAFYVCHFQGECGKKFPVGNATYCEESLPVPEKKK